MGLKYEQIAEVKELKKIIFINPAVPKLERGVFASNALGVLMDHPISSTLKLSAMVFAEITPSTYEFIYIDEEIEKIDFEMDADLVAITAMTVQASRAYQISERFRSRGIPVVIGGIHASVLPEEVKEHCDAVAIGEGENIWPEMLKDFEQDMLKEFYNAKDYPPVDKLTSPRVDVVKHDYYLLLPLQATRGCPYDCEFCSIKFSAGHKYRMKPVEQVVAEIKEYEKYNKKRLGGFKKGYVFVDDNLYVNREYVKKLFTAMNGLGISWTGQGTINMAFDDEILTLMAASGCKTYSIGFESISEESLKEANKPKINKTNDYAAAIGNLIRHGIIPAGYFIYGFDGDDKGVFQKTVDFAYKSHLLQPSFNVLTPYPGTRLYDRLKAEGRIFDNNWEHYNTSKCVFTPKHIEPPMLDDGAMWSSKQLADFEVIKAQLSYFWSQGPWPTIKRLTLLERAALFGLAMKLRKHGNKFYKFLMWAARQKNAQDFSTIIAALVIHEAVIGAKGGESFESYVKSGE
ncbi:MAG: B12-binding domain-containing radical SAM protein [Firmicutes bacterium]|nr:B12-binding domain-containing radical SAM protein [Bacillota bacterium]